MNATDTRKALPEDSGWRRDDRHAGGGRPRTASHHRSISATSVGSQSSTFASLIPNKAEEAEGQASQSLRLVFRSTLYSQVHRKQPARLGLTPRHPLPAATRTPTSSRQNSWCRHLRQHVRRRPDRQLARWAAPSTWALRRIAWTVARAFWAGWAAKVCMRCRRGLGNPAHGQPHRQFAVAGRVESTGSGRNRLDLASFGHRLSGPARRGSRPPAATRRAHRARPSRATRPTMDSGTSDGGASQELARLSNFVSGGNETHGHPAGRHATGAAVLPCRCCRLPVHRSSRSATQWTSWPLPRARRIGIDLRRTPVPLNLPWHRGAEQYRPARAPGSQPSSSPSAAHRRVFHAADGLRGRAARPAVPTPEGPLPHESPADPPLEGSASNGFWSVPPHSRSRRPALIRASRCRPSTLGISESNGN